MTLKQDSNEYLKKKLFFNQIVTLYGRKPVLEILQDKNLKIYRLHLAESNKTQGIINEIIQAANEREVEIQYHSREALSRLSKNGKQDQGVCIDVFCSQHQHANEFLANLSDNKPYRLIALDRITNPQNLGMIIRSVCAGQIDGLIIPQKGCANIDGLVVKASAGTLFKAPLLHCENLTQTLTAFRKQGAHICALSSHAKRSIAEPIETSFIVYVLGNETEGVNQEVEEVCNESIAIPMNNGVESLNVAVTASLLAFREVLNRSS